MTCDRPSCLHCAMTKFVADWKKQHGETEVSALVRQYPSLEVLPREEVLARYVGFNAAAVAGEAIGTIASQQGKFEGAHFALDVFQRWLNAAPADAIGPVSGSA